MKHRIAAIVAGGFLGLGLTLAASSPALALPPNPVEPWGQAVSVYARTLPPNPVKGSLVSIFARLHGEDPPVIIIDSD